MPLETEQISWLNQTAGAGLVLPDDGAPPDGGLSDKQLQAKLRTQLELEMLRDEKRKALALADVQNQLKPLRGMMREAFDLQVQYESGKIEQLLAKDGDLSGSVDVRDVKGSSKVSKSGSDRESTQQEHSALMREAQSAYDLVLSLRRQLEAMTTTRSKISPDGELYAGEPRPLFTTAELMDELFTPLVRQKVLPDTVITDRYSAVQRMIDGSNALYKAELKEAAKPTTSPELLKKMVDLGSEITGTVLEMVGADTKLATTLLEGTTELVKLSCDLGAKIKDGVDVKSVTDFLDGLPSVIGSMVGAALGDKSLGELVGGAGSVGTKAIAAIANSIRTRKPVPSLLIDFVSEVVSFGLGQIDSGSDRQKATVTFGDDLQKALMGVASSHADAFFEKVLAGDMAAARKEMFGVIKDVVLKLPSLAKDAKDLGTASDEVKPKGDDEEGGKEDEGEDEDEDDPLGDGLETGAEVVDGLKEEIEKQLEEHEKLLEELGASVDEAAKKRAELESNPAAYAKSIEEELKQEQEDFKKELEGLNDPTADDQKIEALMARIQRDRAIMSVAVMIGQGGFQVASKFFAPMSMGTEAVKMAANIAAAVKRAQDLRKFLEQQLRARNAVSPYLTSVQNFVDNQENQLTQYAIRVALNGAAIAAAAAATAFPLAAPGVAIVGAVQSGTEVLFEVYDEKRLKDAWKLTKSALDDPSNRKMGLRARRLNPTLAKYTVAYGAEIERDPIALSMCQACGLSRETVAKADAKKIKAYLVLRFNEDGEVINAYDDTADWQADLPEATLTPDCVMRTFAVIGEANDRGLFRGKASGAFNPPSGLVALVRAVAADLATDATAEQMEERMTLLGSIVEGFKNEAGRLQPLGDGAGESVEAFAGIAETKANKLVLELLKAKVAAAQTTTPP